MLHVELVCLCLGRVLGWFGCFDLFWLGLGNSVGCARILFVATIYVGLDLLLGLLFTCLYMFVLVIAFVVFLVSVGDYLVLVLLDLGVWFDL